MDFSEFCSRLLEKTDIIKLISRYTPLRRMGSSYMGCCPFHNEKTPSFNVDPTKQLYFCFGCKKGGNAITFLSDIENIDRFDAIRILAEEANMELPELENSRVHTMDKEHRLRLYALLKEAARYYNSNLNDPKAAIAREYLQKRAIPDNIVTRFGLGYSKGYNDVIEYLKGKGYTPKEMQEVGIAAMYGDKWYDVFHDRLMFPIINTFGDVIGFGGRVLEKSDKAKYRNSPQSAIFDKSKTLYGVNLLKRKKKKGDIEYVIMCEGYMDVIALHKAGFDTAIASMGTSLTSQQARLIKNYSNLVYISYDGDFAGQKATLRGLEILKENGLTVRVVTLPDGQDPDEIINRNGKGAYEKLLAEAKPLVEFKLNVIRSKYNLENRDDRAKYAEEAVKCVTELDSPVEAEEYLKTVAEETGYDMNVLRKQADIVEVEKKEELPRITKKENEVKSSAYTNYLLASYLTGKEYVDPEELMEVFPSGYERSIIDSITHSRLNGTKDVGAMLYVDIPEEYLPQVTEIVEYDFKNTDREDIYRAYLNSIKSDKLEKEIKDLLSELGKADNEAILERIKELQSEQRRLRNNGGIK